jgi:riboflavin kinase/FMN adenylyltransferase
MIENSPIPSNHSGTVVTVGTFDGIHLGHRAVLSYLHERAVARGLASLLVTFEPHPLVVVNPAAAPQLLTVGSERKEFLAQCDVDYVAFLPFTPELSKFTPREFVELLLQEYSMKELVIGYDHGLGKGRAGDSVVLESLGKEMGFDVDVVAAVTEHERPVSSTLIRRAIAGGDLPTAGELLGRQYSISGRVVRGAGRGEGLGFRTVNLEVPDRHKLLPPDGVYAVWVETARGRIKGMMNQGGRPTFGDEDRVLEAHLFDFQGDLYDTEVKLSWCARVRDTKRFSSPEALMEQLKKDEIAARSALTESIDATTH